MTIKRENKLMPSTNPQSDVSVSPVYHPDCRYWLARQTGPMAVQLVDGCHGSPAEVAKAIKLMSGIFKDDGPWLMVELHPAPDATDAQVNEEAVAACAVLLDEFGPGRQP